tara:strand:- start:54 stop:293 length:240 start_codon:yes stop_codon:yes gene_type:complete
MKLLTYLIYTLLALHFMGCKGEYKSKHQFRQERMEKRDSVKMLHPDSIRKYREIRWEKKKAKIDAKFDSLKVAKEDTVK